MFGYLFKKVKKASYLLLTGELLGDNSCANMWALKGKKSV